MPIGRPKKTQSNVVTLEQLENNPASFSKEISLVDRAVPLSEYKKLEERIKELEKGQGLRIQQQPRIGDWIEPTKKIYTAKLRKFPDSHECGGGYVIDFKQNRIEIDERGQKYAIMNITTLDKTGNTNTFEMKLENFIKTINIETVKIIDRNIKTLTQVSGVTQQKSISSDLKRMIVGEYVPMTVTKQDITYQIETDSGQQFSVKDNVLNI